MALMGKKTAKNFKNAIFWRFAENFPWRDRTWDFSVAAVVKIRETIKFDEKSARMLHLSFFCTILYHNQEVSSIVS